MQNWFSHNHRAVIIVLYPSFALSFSGIFSFPHSCETFCRFLSWTFKAKLRVTHPKPHTRLIDGLVSRYCSSSYKKIDFIASIQFPNLSAQQPFGFDLDQPKVIDIDFCFQRLSVLKLFCFWAVSNLLLIFRSDFFLSYVELFFSSSL